MSADDPTDPPTGGSPPTEDGPRAEGDAGSAAADASAASAPAEGQAHRPRRRRRRRRGPPRPATADTANAADGSTNVEGAAPGDPGAGGPTVETAPVRPTSENTLHLRTRPPRRRRRPSLTKPASEAPTTTPTEGGEADASAPAEGADAAVAAVPAAPGPRLGPDGQPLRRRRRRRRPPQFGAAADTAAGAQASTDDKPAEAAPADQPRRPPRHRRRRPLGDRPADRSASEGQEAGRHEGRPERGRRFGERGPREGDRRRDGPSGRRDRRDGRDGRGRGRDERPKQIERKLYSIDSIVDRGFEDVEEEAGTRRVHWTIVKRTVADQITRKPMSQNYVLQREGGDDSEFPSLGAARDAVNKKIIHPEKLTLSKAEHAAQKSGR